MHFLSQRLIRAPTRRQDAPVAGSIIGAWWFSMGLCLLGCDTGGAAASTASATPVPSSAAPDAPKSAAALGDRQVPRLTAPAGTADATGVTTVLLSDKSGLQVRLQLVPPDGWRMMPVNDGDSDATLMGADVATDPLSVESAISIGLTCMGDCTNVRKSAMADASNRYQLHSKRGLDIEWLQRPAEDPSSTISSSFHVTNTDSGREQYFLVVARLLSAPRLLACPAAAGAAGPGRRSYA
jgi:hypothetical protein